MTLETKSTISKKENILNNTSILKDKLFHLGFDENTGTIIEESEGFFEPGYINYVFNDARFQSNRDPQHTKTAITGNALIFDGYSTYIEYEDATIESESIACSVWVAPRAYEWGDKGLPSTILSQYDSTTATGFQFGIYRHGSYGVEIQTKKGKLSLISSEIQDFLPKFAWSYLVFSYDSSTGTLDLYKNGVKMMSETLYVEGGNPYIPCDGSLYIGKNSEGAGIATFSANMFDGVMDELCFYGMPLSEVEVKAMFDADLEPYKGTIPTIAFEAIALDVDIVKDDINRPTFHIGAPQHWMNEPHGAFYYKGQYHIFYQHNPIGPYWHEIHWGHLVSTDMIHWRYLPDALAPSFGSVAPDGIWSGSSVLDRKGNPVIFYTAGNDSMSPNQNIAIARPRDLDDSDLVEWVMEPALTVQQQHGQGAFGTFRDPYVWYDKTSDYYYMLVGSGTGNEGGTALAYRSFDLEKWEYFGPFMTTNYQKYPYLGQHWELPVFMTLSNEKGESKDILLLSPHGEGANIEVYYYTGYFDRETVRFIKDSDEPKKFDLGNGVFTGPSGFFDPISQKNILFTIAQGERDSWAEYYAGWAHNGGMPLELSLNDQGTLYIEPVQGLKSLRKEALVTLENVTVDEANNYLQTIKGDVLDIELTFSEVEAKVFGLYVRTTEDFAENTRIIYNVEKQGLYLDRLHSSLDKTKKDIVGDSLAFTESLSLRILVDRSLIEIYANHERSLTARVYPTLADANCLKLFENDGHVLIKKLIIYPMDSIY